MGGLSKGGRVRYRGVEVGQVVAVRLVKDRPELIRVDIDVDPSTPVTRDTEARIVPQGITGLSYIELTTREPGPPPKTPEGELYPVIRAEPSQLDRVFQDLPELVGDLTRLTERMERVLSEDNVRYINRTVANAARLSRRLNELAERADTTLTEVHQTFGQAGGALEGMDRTMERARLALGKVGSLAGRLDALVARHEDRLDQLAGRDLDELRQVLRDSQRTLEEIQGLARTLRENPSRMVVPPKTGGMEVPR